MAGHQDDILIKMTYEDELAELLEQGYSEEEAMEFLEHKEEEEHFAFFVLQEIINRQRNQ